MNDPRPPELAPKLATELGRDVPPPNAALRALVAQAQPVSTRRPTLQLVAWLGFLFALALIAVRVVGLRVDHDALPQAQFMLAAAVWVLAIATGASLALVPPAGQVLPSLARARIGLLLVLVFAFVAGLALLGDAPGVTRHLDSEHALLGVLHCERFGVLLAVPGVALAWLLVVRRIPVGAATVGATIGAAAGAVSGLALHVVCSTGGALHAVFGHIGVVFVGAALGALATLRAR